MRFFKLLLAFSFVTLALTACNTRRGREDGGVVRLDGSPMTDGSSGTDSGPPPTCSSGGVCPTGRVCVDGVCVLVAVDAGRDAGTPVGGGCAASCLASPGAVCCQDCGCGGAAVRCDPVCPAPYMWDCEVGCCFNYTTRMCLPAG